MMLRKFWDRSKINWSKILDISSSLEVRSVMEWLVHCAVLMIGFPSKLTERLLPLYYDVALVLGSIRNQMVKEIGHFNFVEVRSVNGVVGALHSSLIGFPSKLTKSLQIGRASCRERVLFAV